MYLCDRFASIERSNERTRQLRLDNDFCYIRRFDHVTPSLTQLHWPPVSYRIKFKLCCLMHAIHHGLTETVNSISSSRPRSSSMDYSLPQLCIKFGQRAFSHAGPSTWNSLQDNVHAVADPAKFRKLLKSHYFSAAFNIC